MLIQDRLAKLSIANGLRSIAIDNRLTWIGGYCPHFVKYVTQRSHVRERRKRKGERKAAKNHWRVLSSVLVTHRLLPTYDSNQNFAP